MEHYKLFLKGPKQLEWETNEIKDIQDDEIIVKTIAGAISIGAELPQYNGSDVQIRILFIQEKLDMKVMVK